MKKPVYVKFIKNMSHYNKNIIRNTYYEVLFIDDSFIKLKWGALTLTQIYRSEDIVIVDKKFRKEKLERIMK